MRNMIVRTACALALLGITPVHAVEYISSHIPDAKAVGEGRLSFMMWDIYDARLYAPAGSWSKEKPFALELSYLREVSGEKIADRSVEEMRNQGYTNEVKLADWHTQMRDIFPDVNEGNILTGVYANNGETIFYKDDNEIGRISDPEFGLQFFNIWLSEKTSAPDLRRKLLGML